MSTILCIYEKPPTFPATDQHPDAVRYAVGPYIVDALGGEPALSQIEALLFTSVGDSRLSAIREELRNAIESMPVEQRTPFSLILKLLDASAYPPIP